MSFGSGGLRHVAWSDGSEGSDGESEEGADGAPLTQVRSYVLVVATVSFRRRNSIVLNFPSPGCGFWLRAVLPFITTQNVEEPLQGFVGRNLAVSSAGAPPSPGKAEIVSDKSAATTDIKKAVFPTMKEAVTAVRLHFIGQNKTAKQHNFWRGGKYKVLCCASRFHDKPILDADGNSILDKDGNPKTVSVFNPESSCKAQVVISKSKSKKLADEPFRFSEKNTVWLHINCNGKSSGNARDLRETRDFKALVGAKRKATKGEMKTVAAETGFSSMSTSALYRAQGQLNQEDARSFIQSFQMLPSWADKFNATPGNGEATLHFDDVPDAVVLEGEAGDPLRRFKQITVVFEGNVQLWLKGGQRDISMVDMTHSRHEEWKGQHIGMVSQCGNKQTITLAWGLCPVENEECYTRFFEDLKRFQLEGCNVIYEALNRVTHAQLSDRHKGIPGAQRQCFALMRSKACGKHMVPNACKAAGDFSDTKAQGKFWGALSATTKLLHDRWMDELLALAPRAHAYFSAIPVETWAFHPDSQTLSMYGHKTSNLIEGANAKFCPARFLNPLRALDNISELVMSEITGKREAAKRRYKDGKGDLLTKHAVDAYEVQRTQASRFQVSKSSDTVYFVKYGEKRRKVDIEAKTCSCSDWKQFGIPCRHAIAVAQKAKLMDNYAEFVAWAFDPMYLLSNYMGALESAKFEPISLDDLAVDTTTLPSINAKPAGRPKKRRIRSRGDTAAGGGVVPRPQKCQRCGSDGHNSRTCTKQKKWGV